MASQAFSASANVLKGDPPTLMAGLLIWMGRQEATKPGRPWRPGPLLLSLLITNEKPRSLATHISNSCRGSDAAEVQGHSTIQRAPKRPYLWGRQPVAGFLPARGNGGIGPEAGIRRVAEPPVPAIATFSRR